MSRQLLIASDLHGSAKYTEKLLEAFEREGAERLILLGDIYNPGPRNPISEGYNPMDVAKMLNAVKGKLSVVKGNCDSQVDTLISQFRFVESLQLIVGDCVITCAHGHEFDMKNPPCDCGDLLLYGHVHRGFIEKRENITIANPGSVSLPQEGSRRGYLVFDDGMLALKSLDGEVFESATVK